MRTPGYPPTDSLIYLQTVAGILRDAASALLSEDHGPNSPHDELMQELADKMHELAKVNRHEAEAHGCAKDARYSSGGLVVTPGKIWHPLEVQP